MKKVSKNVSFDLKYLRYGKEGIFYYEAYLNGTLFLKSVTDYQGIKMLKNAQIPSSLNLTLLSIEEIENFRKMDFNEAYIKIEPKQNFFELINNKEYKFVKMDRSKQILLNTDNTPIPLFLNFSIPYVFKDENFDLEKLAEHLNLNERVVNLENSTSEPVVKEFGKIKIIKIPYYNSNDDSNNHIKIGYIPSDEDFKNIYDLQVWNRGFSKISKKDAFLKLDILNVEQFKKNKKG